MHGLTGGRWRSDSHGEPEPCTRWETNGTEPDHLPLADQPAAYLTPNAMKEEVPPRRPGQWALGNAVRARRRNR